MRLLFLLLFSTTVCFASHTDTLQIQLNKQSFQAGDTISFTAAFQPWIAAKKSGTLNVVIEDIHHTALWRFRYPVLEGETLADIILPADMPSDLYACYFSLQDDFFSMRGKVLSPYKDKAIKITMMLADKEFLSQAISLNEQKEFSMKKVLFADRAKVFFSPIKPNRTNDLEISLEVSLDACWKLSKMLSSFPVSMPIPVSAMENWMQAPKKSSMPPRKRTPTILLWHCRTGMRRILVSAG